MSRPRNPFPKYELHRTSGQARVRVKGRDIYLGKFGSPESRQAYARVCAELVAAAEPKVVAAKRRATVAEVLVAFVNHARTHYRAPDGSLTSEYREHGRAMLHLDHLYGDTPAVDFGPLALKAVRNAMIKEGWGRKTINRRVERIRRIFRWAVGEELVPVSVVDAIDCVSGLQKNRSEAHETERIKPAPLADVNATLPYLDRHQRTMARLQLYTGMRPGEVCVLKLCEVDRTGPVWVWRPDEHKTAWREKDKAIVFGPKAQQLVAEFLSECHEDLRPKDEDWLFSPRAAQQERFRARRAARKTKVQPSQISRRKASPKRTPAAHYRVSGYDHAVTRACDKAKVTQWAPNQLRHTFGTEVRKLFGLEAVQVLLGHATADVTQIYAERDFALALRVAGEIG